MSKCQKCGTEFEGNYCPACGIAAKSDADQAPSPDASNQQSVAWNQGANPEGNQGAKRCPKCGSTNISFQVMQENTGSTTLTSTKSKYKEKGHGCLWWIFIGSWWWMIDLCLWIFLFIPRLIIQLCKKKKYKGTSNSVSQTVNQITYKSICQCQSCGHHWEA